MKYYSMLEFYYQPIHKTKFKNFKMIILSEARHKRLHVIQQHL